jgi:YesN/AraC family two-component response regulator
MKILIVDDEPLIRLGLSTQASDWGYEVLEAAAAEQAIRLIEVNPDIRLLITDVDMPGSMDGARLAHIVKHRWPPMAVIVISGKLLVPEADLPAGSRFFSKPVHEHRLRDAMQELTR